MAQHRFIMLQHSGTIPIQKKAGATFGPAPSQTIDPKQFLRKHEKEPVLNDRTFPCQRASAASRHSVRNCGAVGCRWPVPVCRRGAEAGHPKQEGQARHGPAVEEELRVGTRPAAARRNSYPLRTPMSRKCPWDRMAQANAIDNILAVPKQPMQREPDYLSKPDYGVCCSCPPLPSRRSSPTVRLAGRDEIGQCNFGR